MRNDRQNLAGLAAVESAEVAKVRHVNFRLLDGEVRKVAFLNTNRLSGGKSGIGECGETSGCPGSSRGEEVPARDGIFQHALMFLI
jgi:hypothetical protein